VNHPPRLAGLVWPPRRRGRPGPHRPQRPMIAKFTAIAPQLDTPPGDPRRHLHHLRHIRRHARGHLSGGHVRPHLFIEQPAYRRRKCESCPFRLPPSQKEPADTTGTIGHTATEGTRRQQAPPNPPQHSSLSGPEPHLQLKDMVMVMVMSGRNLTTSGLSTSPSPDRYPKSPN